MDNAQKAIMIGVGLFITIIIIAAVMLITGAGQDLMNEGMNQLSGISANLQAQLTQDYDGRTMNGSDVIAAVKSKYKTDGLIVCVNNGNGDVHYGTVKGENAVSLNGKKYEVSGTTNKEYQASKIGIISNKNDKAAYVNPTVKYTADLIYIAGTDAVVGIYFHK